MHEKHEREVAEQKLKAEEAIRKELENQIMEKKRLQEEEKMKQE